MRQSSTVKLPTQRRSDFSGELLTIMSDTGTVFAKQNLSSKSFIADAPRLFFSAV